MLDIIKLNLILALLCLLFQVLMHRDTFFGVRRLMLWGIYATVFLLPLWNVQALLTADTAATDMAEAYAVYVLPTLNVTAMRVASFGVEQSESGCGMRFVGMMALWGLIYLIPVVWMTVKLIGQIAYIIYLRCTCPKMKSERVKSEKYEIPWQSECQASQETFIFHFSLFHFSLRCRRHPLFTPKVFLYPRPCSPFSFGPWIFIHPEGMDEQTLREILIHEQAHVRGWHTLDILFSQLVCILFWWNPAAWVMRREVRLNLEFIADKAVADYLEMKSALAQQGRFFGQSESEERVKSEKYKLLSSPEGNPYFSLGGEADIFRFSLKMYQYRLLGFSTQKNVATIVNNFNVLPLKRRIIMMNLRKTHRTGMVKYLLFVPVAAAMLFLSNIDSLARSIKDMKPIAHIEQSLTNPQTMAPAIEEVQPVAEEPIAVQTEMAVEGSVELTDTDDTSKTEDASLETLEGLHDNALLIIDKNVATKEEVAKLNTEDIESITVLKGEAATAIWGSRGANGVIDITTKNAEKDDKIYETCEQMPEYPGGPEAMFTFIMNNIRYPKAAQEYGVQGKVTVSFVVEKDGTLSDVKAVQAIDPKTKKTLPEVNVVAYDKNKSTEENEQARQEAEHEVAGVKALKAEAERTVKALPERWTPGKDKGKPVRTRFILPVTFRLK